jgi:signal recognition particle subunit SRP54
MGEKLTDMEAFHPDRMASRILGMGDIMTLIEKAQAEIDDDKAREMEQKLRKASFDYNDYLESMRQMKKMGGLSSVLSMLPGMGLKTQDLENAVNEKQMARIEAMILSMTPKERENPDLLNPSRKNRIAKGAGVDIAEVNRLVKNHKEMQKQMKQFSGMMGNGKRGGFMGRKRFPF